MNGEIVGNGLVGNLSGTGSLTAVLDYVPSSTTTYEGSYTISPSNEEQTLETQNKLMIDDLVIEAIPPSEFNCKAGEIVNSAFSNNIVKVGIISTTNTSLASLFSNMTGLEEVEQINIPNATNLSSLFMGCVKLKKPPILDTTNITNMRYMFQSCLVLENVPLYNTKNVGDMRNMFTSCPNLTDDSLNNILQMCINATSYSRTKTLASLGLDSTNYPASRIQGLSNYQAFLNAGWSIGY